MVSGFLRQCITRSSQEGQGSSKEFYLVRGPKQKVQGKGGVEFGNSSSLPRRNKNIQPGGPSKSTISKADGARVSSRKRPVEDSSPISNQVTSEYRWRKIGEGRVIAIDGTEGMCTRLILLARDMVNVGGC